MFQVDDYKVEFKHERGNEKHAQEIGIPVSWTDCFIIRDNKTVATGYAYLHPNDTYNKNTGRKLALARALKELTENRDLRKRFWDAYFTARNGKK